MVNSIGEGDSMKLGMNCMCTLTVEVRSQKTSKLKIASNGEAAKRDSPPVNVRYF